MSEYWLAAAIGAGIGVLMLALFARLPAAKLADSGFAALIAMVSVYMGAQLVSGEFNDILIETGIAIVWVIVARLAMMRWLPSIGVAVFCHGLYDAFVGPHMGVADWYPPLCAGFDFLVGVGLVAVLLRKSRLKAY
ncbi:MAG: hypothetical protein AAGE86_07140 [Pseudomonadota bacterium]